MQVLNIVLIIIFIIILVIFRKYNQFIRLRGGVKKAKANIETCLNKRFELIPNLVETVKGYSKYEEGTLENIVSLRNKYNSTDNINLQEANDMNNKLNELLVLVENYPDLKANTQYLSLQQELSKIENDLERARVVYNDEVTRYNIALDVVPSNLIAGLFAFKKAELFQIADDNKDVVKIEL